ALGQRWHKRNPRDKLKWCFWAQELRCRIRSAQALARLSSSMVLHIWLILEPESSGAPRQLATKMSKRWNRLISRSVSLPIYIPTTHSVLQMYSLRLGSWGERNRLNFMGRQEPWRSAF